ncbi:MAG: DUF1343 domain-containing protein [Psychromonas sp.]|nr:DUF1343 domain-containing protein [Psychromonas sp.]
MKKILFTLVFSIGFVFSTVSLALAQQKVPQRFLVGAKNIDYYLPLLINKRVGLVVNQTSMIADVRLIDFLIAKKVNIIRLFSPEHGIGGKTPAGKKVETSIDLKTGLPVTSLYGDNKKPTDKQLKDVDVLVFDLQDVGVRYFTYISTLHLVMEAAAENNKMLIILDRPNPNGGFIDGPIMQPKYESFVGIDPIPLLHGLSVGELALMINGEGWLKNGVKVKHLYISKMQHYKHNMRYILPVKPSPNLPNELSVRLYPSLGLFESSSISIGRGTNKPLQMIGFNDKRAGKLLGRVSDKGWPQEGKVVYGDDLSHLKYNKVGGLNLGYYISWYKKLKKLGYADNEIITKRSWLASLMGTDSFYQQVIAGKSSKEIKASWAKGLANYKKQRKKYLLYP